MAKPSQSVIQRLAHRVRGAFGGAAQDEAIADIVAAPIEDKDPDTQASTSPPEVHVMFVSAETLGHARKLIRGCQACSPSADVPFEEILDRVSGHRAAVTRYIFLGSVTCPRCWGRVAATTLIEVDPPTHRAI